MTSSWMDNTKKFRIRVRICETMSYDDKLENLLAATGFPKRNHSTAVPNPRPWDYHGRDSASSDAVSKLSAAPRQIATIRLAGSFMKNSAHPQEPNHTVPSRAVIPRTQTFGSQTGPSRFLAEPFSPAVKRGLRIITAHLADSSALLS